jgi:large subunit ribosomal protein L24
MSSKHVRKGDVVIVTSGDFKGKTGEVLRVVPKHDHVIVKGINLVTRNIKPSKAQPQGGQVSREAPLHISKVSHASASPPRPTAPRSAWPCVATKSSGSSAKPQAPSLPPKPPKPLGPPRPTNHLHHPD